jgi:hypothetical protein
MRDPFEYIRKNIVLLSALLIWCMPTLAFWGFVLATTPHGWGWSGGSLIMIIFLMFFILTLLVAPILFLSRIFYLQPISVLVLVYFVVAYGLLYLWARRRGKKKG